MPEPASPNSGLGMNVAVMPMPRAVMRVTYLARRTTSAARTAGSIRVSISHCPGPPTSWWWYLTGTPIASRCRQIFVLASKSWSWGGIAWYPPRGGMVYPPPSSWLLQPASRDSTRYAAVFMPFS
jgi:hypothetical protein